MTVFPTLDYLHIKGRYPKAVKKVVEWLFEQPELAAQTEQFVDPKNPEESKEMFAGMLIQMDPRKLYDMFDSFGIHVGINPYDGGFSYCVAVDNEETKSYDAPTRIKAEVTAFEDAFHKLDLIS